MEYIIQDTTLTGLADAIRAKTGKTDQLTPAQMAAEVESLEVGGGDTEVEDGLITRGITSCANPRVTTIGSYAFYFCGALQSVSCPAATEVKNNAFQGCGALAAIDFPAAVNIGNVAFRDCKALTSVSLPMAQSLGTSALQSCTNLRDINLPRVASLGDLSLKWCYPLTSVSLPAVNALGSGVFEDDSKLARIIIGNADGICRLKNVSAFSGTPIASGTGYVYVPDALVDGYKAATNWATYADQIKPLSELPEEG